MAKVLITGDSRRMKGGVSTVIKTLESTFMWQKYHCHWVQCQINSNLLLKFAYLIRGYADAFLRMPFYDIVYFHTAPGMSMSIQKPIFLYAELLKKRIVLELHVGDQIRDHLNDKTLRYGVNHSDLVLTLGRKWRDLLSSQDWVHTPVDYLRNPAPELSEPCSPERYFLFAAYFDRNKGYGTLIQAFAKLLVCYPGWKLVLCGAGDVEGVKACVSDAGLNDSVIFPGWVSGEDKKRMFRKACAYCMTSEKEGLPMSVIEAMAWGTAVISTFAGCLPEILKDGESAMMFHFGNADELAGKMAALIEKPDLRISLVKRSQEIIRTEFSSDMVAGKLDKIFSELSQLC